ncbi:hypothetical protein SOVF_096320 [Spinacia oleracea]|nr:hypothetical protein SOVF_096320 [Spinacia oleracea]
MANMGGHLSNSSIIQFSNTTMNSPNLDLTSTQKKSNNGEKTTIPPTKKTKSIQAIISNSPTRKYTPTNPSHLITTISTTISQPSTFPSACGDSTKFTTTSSMFQQNPPTVDGEQLEEVSIPYPLHKPQPAQTSHLDPSTNPMSGRLMQNPLLWASLETPPTPQKIALMHNSLLQLQEYQNLQSELLPGSL